MYRKTGGKGLELGIIGKEYRTSGLKLQEAILQLTDDTGFLHQVSIGTPLGFDKDFYKEIPLIPMGYGQALGMLYLIRAMKE